MEYILVSGARIGFNLAGGFKWFNWNGEAELKVPSKGLRIDGNEVATTDDLRDWISTTLISKQYDGLTFDQAGTVISVESEPVRDSSTVLTINGIAVATEKSNGEFTLTVQPAAFDKKAKLFDVPKKHGNWKVLNPGQSAGESD